MLLFVFIAKYIFPTSAVEINRSKTFPAYCMNYLNQKISKTIQKWDWTKCFPYNSPLAIKSQI